MLILRKIQGWQNRKRMERITGEVRNITPGKVKILFGPSFSVYHALKIHDTLLTAALAAKGAQITYLSCPFGLGACNACGGITQLANSRMELCAYCRRFARNDSNLTEYLGKYAKILRTQDIVSRDEVQKLKKQTEEISDADLENYAFEGLPFGRYSVDLVRNEGHVDNIKLVPDYRKQVRNSIFSNLIFYRYFDESIKREKPDIIVSHDAFYAPWIVLMDLARRHHLPFYNYYPGMNHNSFFYVKDKIATEFDMTSLFSKWKDRPIDTGEYKKLDKFFADRKKFVIYDMKMQTQKNPKESGHYQKFLESKKPLAVLYTNVLWDLASLNREIIFSSVQESYLETVRFFMKHPQYNLIIKPHPSDLFHTHESKEQAFDLISETFPNLPENILLLRPDTPLTSYELFDKSRVSIVHTTTVGIESPIFGTPAITLGRTHYRGQGFTNDPETAEEYFRMLEDILNGKNQRNPEKEKALATKYYYLLNYCYWYDFGIIKYNFKARSKAVVIPKSLKDLLANHDFSRLAEAIINRQDIPFFDSRLEKT